MSDFQQNQITKEFIDEVNWLIDLALVKNQAEIVKKLDWNPSTMSEVMSGKRNVPHKIAYEFFKVYADKISGKKDSSKQRLEIGDIEPTDTIPNFAKRLIYLEATTKTLMTFVAELKSQISKEPLTKILYEIEKECKVFGDSLYHSFTIKQAQKDFEGLGDQEVKP